MSNFVTNNAQAFNLKKLNVLETSSNILNKSHSAAVLRTGKDVLLGNTAPPRNIAEALQMFNESIFGKPADPFYYRSQYGVPIYSYLLIGGQEATSTQTHAQLSTLSSNRVGYTNGGTRTLLKKADPSDVGDIPNTWEVLNDDLTLETRGFPAVFMDSAIITVSKKKNIVKTKVVNHDSSRKEYISSNDYDIKITGAFTTNEANIYPTSDVEALIRACEAPIPLDIISPYLFRFGITKMVIESFSFPQERGSYASQKFSISCVSHESAYVEIGKELINDNQSKNAFQNVVDEISNLQSTVNTQIDEFLSKNPF